jgi:hypothetical protein
MSREYRRRSREREPSPGRPQRRCHSRGRQPPPSQLPRERNQVHERVQAMTPLASPRRLDCWPGSPLTGKTSGNAESRVSLSVTEVAEGVHLPPEITPRQVVCRDRMVYTPPRPPRGATGSTVSRSRLHGQIGRFRRRFICSAHRMMSP